MPRASDEAVLIGEPNGRVRTEITGLTARWRVGASMPAMLKQTALFVHNCAMNFLTLSSDPLVDSAMPLGLHAVLTP
jgi:hypothetical protein